MERQSSNRQSAIYENTHAHYSMIVPDAVLPTADEQIAYNFMNKWFRGDYVDDDSIDAGAHDFLSDAAVFVSGGCVPGKINNSEPLGYPELTDGGAVALANFKLGSYAGGPGVSYGTTAAQTVIDLVDITHNITEIFAALGGIAVYSVAGNINWVRAADLVVGARILATIAGDATKVVLAVLPDSTTNQDGNPNPGLRMFFGCTEFFKLNVNGGILFDRILEFGLHQTRQTPVSRIIEAVRRIVQSGEQFVYPFSAAGVQLITNAANWTYGNYANVITIATIMAPYRLTGTVIENYSDPTEIYQLEFAKISDGSTLGVAKTVAAAQNATLNFAISSRVLAAGDGVKVRAMKSGNAGTAKNITISLNYEIFT